MPEPFKTFIENGRLWKWERSQELQTTACWPILFPIDETHDVSWTIWGGQKDGYGLNTMFDLHLAPPITP
jgi:hypothetical protein